MALLVVVSVSYFKASVFEVPDLRPCVFFGAGTCAVHVSAAAGCHHLRQTKYFSQKCAKSPSIHVEGSQNANVSQRISNFPHIPVYKGGNAVTSKEVCVPSKEVDFVCLSCCLPIPQPFPPFFTVFLVSKGTFQSNKYDDIEFERNVSFLRSMGRCKYCHTVHDDQGSPLIVENSRIKTSPSVIVDEGSKSSSGDNKDINTTDSFSSKYGGRPCCHELSNDRGTFNTKAKVTHVPSQQISHVFQSVNIVDSETSKLVQFIVTFWGRCCP